MPRFSDLSFSRLSTCDIELQTLFFEVVKHFDCTILEGHRNEEDQNKAFETAHSKVKWPHGKHNAMPSLAVDVAPYPIPDWKDLKCFYWFAGYVLGTAEQLKAQGKMTKSIRFGGDWNSDMNINEKGLKDLVHFEVIS